MDGKIPPPHQIIETLGAALEESWQENSRICQAKPAKYRNFPSKNLLQKHDIEFPKRNISTCCSSNSDTPVVADFSRLLPENEFEEAEQLEISIRESVVVCIQLQAILP